MGYPKRSSGRCIGVVYKYLHILGKVSFMEGSLFISAGHSQNQSGSPKAKEPKILVAQNGH